MGRNGSNGTNEFEGAKAACGFHPAARKIVDMIKARGRKLVLATNPIFPAVATKKRIQWAGLMPEDFVLFTTYENSCYSKPNLQYYLDILEKIGCCPEECLMVGNDVSEDMIAETLGMKVFLLTDCLINKRNQDVSAYAHGGFQELQEYLNTILK